MGGWRAAKTHTGHKQPPRSLPPEWRPVEGPIASELRREYRGEIRIRVGAVTGYQPTASLLGSTSPCPPNPNRPQGPDPFPLWQSLKPVDPAILRPDFTSNI